LILGLPGVLERCRQCGARAIVGRASHSAAMKPKAPPKLDFQEFMGASPSRRDYGTPAHHFSPRFSLREREVSLFPVVGGAFNDFGGGADERVPRQPPRRLSCQANRSPPSAPSGARSPRHTIGRCAMRRRRTTRSCRRTPLTPAHQKMRSLETPARLPLGGCPRSVLGPPGAAEKCGSAMHAQYLDVHRTPRR